MTERLICRKCGGKRFFGKYTDKPYCIDCGTFTERNTDTNEEANK